MRRIVPALVLATIACGIVGSDDAEENVTVIDSIELIPADIRGVAPTARYLHDSNVLIFRTEARYSSTCRPTGRTEAGDRRTLTLTVDYDGRNCASDAVSCTFLIPGIDAGSGKLVVVEDGHEDLHIDISG